MYNIHYIVLHSAFQLDVLRFFSGLNIRTTVCFESILQTCLYQNCIRWKICLTGLSFKTLVACGINRKHNMGKGNEAVLGFRIINRKIHAAFNAFSFHNRLDIRARPHPDKKSLTFHFYSISIFFTFIQSILVIFICSIIS